MKSNTRTQFIGQTHIHLDETVSTNDYAIELLSKSEPTDGTVISTDFQTSGRGQIDRYWHSSRGANLMMSVILYPDYLPAHQIFLISAATALAVRDFIASILTDQHIYIKWPNDIFVGNEKIAGILIQNSLKGSRISSSVIGIGVNINEDRFPPELIRNSVSLLSLTGHRFDLKKCMEELCERLEARIQMIRYLPPRHIFDIYHRHMYKFGKDASFLRDDGSVITGEITGVDEMGRLQLKTDGTHHSFHMHEIRQIV